MIANEIKHNQALAASTANGCGVAALAGQAAREYSEIQVISRPGSRTLTLSFTVKIPSSGSRHRADLDLDNVKMKRRISETDSVLLE
ncbi:hypothetical protein [Bradyrhizobium sp.]|uniref:hypothetical protein n=1 Tax=Bradyrhizobium sp. TaxID=376 RepID=UPI003C404F45